MYGEGHYSTYDGKRYTFEGRCEYVITEDHCKGTKGTFRIQASNVACMSGGKTSTESGINIDSNFDIRPEFYFIWRIKYLTKYFDQELDSIEI